jgi:hypothetical protein
LTDLNEEVFRSIMKVSLALLESSFYQYSNVLIMYTGECRHVMRNYLACMKKVRGLNDEECRGLAKSYLACRMDK